MQKAIKYAIFETRWGYFGLAGTESAICRAQLPGAELDKVRSRLLTNLPGARFDKTFFKTLQKQIAAYFDGACVNFSPDVPIVLEGLGRFSGAVLTACRDIRFGETVTYAALAEKSGRPAASRAVGSVLAKNPLPLIIPCHRVIRSDGKLGGFSAPGGITLKKKMLEFERREALRS